MRAWAWSMGAIALCCAIGCGEDGGDAPGDDMADTGVSDDTGGSGADTGVATEDSGAQADTTAPDTDEPDAAADTAVEGSPCERACGSIADCSAGDDFCPGIDAEGRDTFYDGCLVQCEGLPALADTVNGMDSCEERVNFLRAANAVFRDTCDGPPSEAECEAALERAVDCFAQDEPDTCAAISEDDRDAIRGTLRAQGLRCPEEARTLVNLTRDASCDAIIDAIIPLSPNEDHRHLCDAPLASDACTAVAQRVASCAVQRCPAISEHEGAIATDTGNLCRDIRTGRNSNTLAQPASEDDVAARINADTPCDDPEIEGRVRALLEDTALLIDGQYAGACDEEPVVEAAICEEACAGFDACLLPGSHPLADPDVCALLCEGYEGYSDRFACAAEADGCLEIADCAQPVTEAPTPHDDTAPACQVAGERAAACFIERCPAMADTAADASGWIALVCTDTVVNGNDTLEDVAAQFGPDTACDSPQMTAFIDYLAEDRMLLRDGVLSDSCAEGPLVDADTCAQACDAYLGCIPEDNNFQLEGVCPFVCASFEQAAGPDVWPCVAEAAAAEGTCADVFRCFSP